MKTRTLEKLTWILIYGGLLAVCVGLATRQSLPTLAAGLMGTGGLVAVAGFSLIYVRSRRKDD